MKVSLTACAAAALMLAMAPAQADEYVYGSWFGASHRVNTKALQPYLAMVEEATGGEVTWKFVPGSQLASGAATPEAVGTGLMDAGLTMAPYQPRMLPATNLIFSHSLIGDDFLASVGAMNETLMLGCPQCKDEFNRNDAVGFGGYGTSPYLFMCRGEPRTMADLQGLKIRGSGGGVSIIELLGGTPVSMTGNEFPTAMERGTLDCVLGSVQWLNSFGLKDMTDTVINAPMGMGGPPVLMYVNRDAWQSMTPEQRAAHIDLTPDLVTMATFDANIEGDQIAIDAGKAAGITFVDGGEDFQEVMRQRDEIQYGLNVENAKKAGVENPEAILDFYLASYERWKTIIAEEVGDDPEAFREAIRREVYSKVDPDAL